MLVLRQMVQVGKGASLSQTGRPSLRALAQQLSPSEQQADGRGGAAPDQELQGADLEQMAQEVITSEGGAATGAIPMLPPCQQVEPLVSFADDTACYHSI